MGERKKSLLFNQLARAASLFATSMIAEVATNKPSVVGF